MPKGYKHGHGQPQTKTYRAWYSMKKRCLVPSCKDYKDYGMRGITVCDEWHEFVNFLNDMGVSPEGTLLERKNNDQGYSKDNCYWATPLQQAKNTRKNVNITYNGETMCRQAWANRLGVAHSTLRNRIKAWGVEKAMEISGKTGK